MHIPRPVIIVVILFSAVTVRSEDQSGLKISGTVQTLDYGEPARVKGARLEFHRGDGISVEASTNKTGEYELVLPYGHEYSVSVSAKGFCSVHRPKFRPMSGSFALRFDFTITTVCPGDRVVVGSPELYFDSPIPSYFEENRSLGHDNLPDQLTISFGKRTSAEHQVRYQPLTVRKHPYTRIPVTLAYATYTVRADQMVIDERIRLLTAKGNVSIADGSESSPRSVPCATLDLTQAVPQPEVCEE
jgi:hypothetical protein